MSIRAPRRPGDPLPPGTLGRALAQVLILLGLLGIVFTGLAALVYVDRLANLGVVWGTQQTPIAGTQRNPLGVNVFLEKEADPANVRRTLRIAHDGGFTLIRQGFFWNDIEIAGKGDFVDRRSGPPHSAWDKYDYIVDQARAFNLDILARLDAPPDWAALCPGPGGHSAPARISDYADFVAAVVSRYRGKIRYFQIWNEPNLEGEWASKVGGRCVRQPNAVEYTALLKAAYQAAHAANPDAVVLMAPLAQTIETGPANLSDLLYLQEMYDAGARPYFDIASVMAYGLSYPPDDRRADPQHINFARPVLTRAIMERNGDGAKGIWSLEYGWISLPADWATNPANKPGIWGNTDEDTQASYLLDGYRRARAEWPWMGPLFVWHMRDPAPLPHEPQPYFGILNADWSPRPAYVALQRYSRRFPVADTGAGTPENPAFTTAGAWEQTPGAGGPLYTATALSSAGTLTFEGSAVDLVFAAGPAPAGVAVLLDGAPPSGWPVDGAGQGIATVPAAGGSGERIAPAPGWPAPPGRPALRLPVAAGLTPARHTLTIRPADGTAPLALLGYVVGRQDARDWMLTLGYTLLTGLALWLGVRSTFRLVALPRLVRQTMAQPGPAGESARAGVTVAAMALVLAAYYLLPWEKAALVPLAAWVLLAAWRPDLALAVTMATIPFFSAPRTLFAWSFPLSETCLWTILFAWGLHRAGHAWAARRGQGARFPGVDPLPIAPAPPGAVAWRERLRLLLQRDLFGAPAVALLVAGTISLLTVANPDYLKSSLHAYRWVIVEPVLLYFLVTEIRPERHQALRLADGLIAGAAIAAAIAVADGLLNTLGHTLQVQGVVRYQGLFTDPNNLGLFLGRSLAFTVPLALHLPRAAEQGRRRAYALATLLLIPALLLSYSRGAWLAVAVALGVVLWMAGGRPARIFAAGLVVVAGGLLLAAEAHLLPERIFHTGSGLIRLDLWKTALTMVRDHPIFGIGLDQFLNQHQGPYLDPAHLEEYWLSHPHNLVLDWWLSLGIIGVLLAGWIAIRYGRGALTLVRHADPWAAAMAQAGLAGMLAVLVHGLVDNSYFLQDLALTFWLFCALLQIIWRQAPAPPDGETGFRRP
ncbi:MAG TPA: O-antigen ligase family protein [Chloroflexia bacterium]|nr:O-antigen ligase family protein [Chloroflexia bacterium]